MNRILLALAVALLAVVAPARADVAVTFTIPAYGHTLDAGLRERKANGVAFAVELAPQSPFASGDPEFDTSDISAWSTLNSGGATTIDANTTVAQQLYFLTSSSSSDQWQNAMTAPFKYQSVTGNFDVYARVSIGPMSSAAYPTVGITAQDPSIATNFMSTVMLHTIANSAARDYNTYNCLSATAISIAESSTVSNVGLQAGTSYYLRLSRTTNDFQGYYSRDAGLNWTSIHAAYTRVDIASPCRLGLVAYNGASAEVDKVAVDFIRTWPPYLTTSPTSTVTVDSGGAATVWDLNTIALLTSPYYEYDPQVGLGFGTVDWQYGAGETNAPSLNGSYVTSAATTVTGRYLRLKLRYTSSHGYERPTFAGAKLSATLIATSGAGPRGDSPQ
jgi:hypothetical protein